MLKSQTTKHLNQLNEESLYELVAKEIAEGTRSPGLTAKAIASSEGDATKAESLYIRYRVEALKLRDAALDEQSKIELKQDLPSKVKETSKAIGWLVLLLFLGLAALILGKIAAEIVEVAFISKLFVVAMWAGGFLLGFWILITVMRGCDRLLSIDSEGGVPFGVLTVLFIIFINYFLIPNTVEDRDIAPWVTRLLLPGIALVTAIATVIGAIVGRQKFREIEKREKFVREYTPTTTTAWTPAQISTVEEREKFARENPYA